MSKKRKPIYTTGNDETNSDLFKVGTMPWLTDLVLEKSLGRLRELGLAKTPKE